MSKKRFDLAKQYGDSLTKIQDEMGDRLKAAKIAYEFMERVEPLLPKHWEMRYEIYGTLYLNRYKQEDEEKVPALEFRVVCDHCDRIMSTRKLNRRINSWDANNPSLRATSYLPEGLVDLQVQLGTPDCKITWREKVVKEHVEKYPEVPDECLGNTKPKEAQA